MKHGLETGDASVNYKAGVWDPGAKAALESGRKDRAEELPRPGAIPGPLFLLSCFLLSVLVLWVQ